MQLDDYADLQKCLAELDLAQKCGLAVLFDTYTKNDKPWGGVAGPNEPHAIHHAASLVELQWLYDRVGQHPALAGFMIGDDQGEVSERSAACTQFLFEHRPHLIPWLCGWIPPRNLAEHNNPIADPQIYPTLYNWGAPAERLAAETAAAYAGYSRQCREAGIIFWPMFNVTGDVGKRGPDMGGYCPSDSLLRFSGYSAIAYGAQGIWYLIYNSGALQHLGEWNTDFEVSQALTPLYPIAQRMNHRIAAWGPKVLGRTSTGLFGTAFGAAAPKWPFAEEQANPEAGDALTPPAAGKLVEGMSDGLIVGILTKDGRAPLAMVVDCRASKNLGDLPSRKVRVRFAPAVRQIAMLEPSGATRVRGREVELTLEAGGGQLLILDGAGLDDLCTTKAIYAPTNAAAAGEPRRLSTAELKGIRAAKLRLDVFGAEGPPLDAKYIDLNGHRLGTVPAGTRDTWVMRVVDLKPGQLAWIRPANELVVRTECDDAWKFRNATLAVQLADGAWVASSTDSKVHSVANWAFSEGDTWGKDGVAGPIRLAFE